MHLWNPQFFENKLLFNPVVEPWQTIIANCAEWPTAQDYNYWLTLSNRTIVSAANKPIKFVPQASQPEMFEKHYEPRIYLKGEVSTRAQNWHDFFNALVWITFPKLKARLNAKQYKYIKQRWKISNLRTTIENALTLFDEGGFIVASSDDNLIRLLQDFSWQDLFYHKRAEFVERMRVIIFGHALYEKALNPYIGITGNAVIVKTDVDFLKKDLEKQIVQLDELLTKQFDNEEWITSTHPFQPLPILGVPGWHEANNNVKFYENHDYFRGKGKRKTVPIVELIG